MLSKRDLHSLAKEAALMPQEEMLAVGRKRQKLYIGIPKETVFQENRVALTPEAVRVLVNNGHRVVVETKAGIGANYEDHEYSDAGAEIVYEHEKAWQADIVLKVAPPSPEEVPLMQRKQTLFSALQLTVQPKDFLQQLMNKKISAIAWDYIKDEEDIYPVIRAMGEIAGNTSILIAGEYLSNANKGPGLMLGGISGVMSTEVTILGAGTVGEFAARAALGLGASVKVFDNSIYKLRRLQNALGTRIATGALQPAELRKALMTTDVVIGAIRGQGAMSPCVVSEEIVSEMKEGAVIVDVSIDQGGCCETSTPTTHENPTFKKHGVIHYCVPNIASRVSRTASQALSNIFTPILMKIGDYGGCVEVIKRDPGFRNGVYIYNGTLTSSSLGDTFNLPYKNIELLTSAM